MSDTPIADMVQELAGNGVAISFIVLAIRTAELASRDASRFVTSRVTPTERTKAALRAARYRENRKQNQHLAKANDVARADSQSVTVERDASRDGVTACTNLSSLLSDPLQEDNRERKEGKGPRQADGGKRGVRLDPNWQPTEELRNFAHAHNVDPDELRAEFVDYWIGVPGQRGCKTADRGWPATWRNRVRKVQTYRKEKNGSGRPRTVQQAAQDQLDRLRAINAPAGTVQLELQPGIRDGTDPPDVRLLPPRGRQ